MAAVGDQRRRRLSLLGAPVKRCQQPQTRLANSICSRGCTMPSEQQCSMTMEV
jgi:hypothetical protein